TPPRSITFPSWLIRVRPPPPQSRCHSSSAKVAPPSSASSPLHISSCIVWYRAAISFLSILIGFRFNNLRPRRRHVGPPHTAMSRQVAPRWHPHDRWHAC